MNKSFVFLHGFSGSPAVWDDVRAELPSEAQVLCPTIAGHAGSAPPCSFELEVERIAAILRGAGSTRIHIVGYSMGARLALALLANSPELFDCATLVSVHPGLQTQEERLSRIAHDESWASTIESEGVAAFVKKWELHPIFRGQTSASEAVQTRQREIRQGHDATGLAAAMRALSLGRMPNFREVLPRIHQHVTLLVGERDTKFISLSQEVASALPSCEFQIVKHAGHNVVLERSDGLLAHLT